MESPSPRHFAPSPPVVIGLLGGIAAGKSTVARIFAEAGLQVIDADAKARAWTERPEVKAQIAARFGNGVLDEQGRLVRARLGQIVFKDHKALADLEALVHPPVRAQIRAELREAVARGRSVLLDVPLLLENGLIDECDLCVFVDADRATRLERARERGWDEQELLRREKNQASVEQKKARCVDTIRNQGSLHETVRQVHTILARLLSTPPT